MVKQGFLLKLTLIILSIVYAPNFCVLAKDGKNEASLIVSGVGKTKDIATEIALRSAIEQSFGVFVSANTSILNDELIKNEIATVASGNIKKYEYLSESIIDGEYSVLLKATVSIDNLITYAESKGSSAVFDGQKYLMNERIKELRKLNTMKAYVNMCEQVIPMFDNAYDYRIKLGAVKNYTIPVTITVLSNAVSDQIHTFVSNTFRNIAICVREEDLSDSDPNLYHGFFERNIYGQRRVMHFAYNYYKYGEVGGYNILASLKMLASLFNFQIEEIDNPSRVSKIQLSKFMAYDKHENSYGDLGRVMLSIKTPTATCDMRLECDKNHYWRSYSNSRWENNIKIKFSHYGINDDYVSTDKQSLYNLLRLITKDEKESNLNCEDYWLTVCPDLNKYFLKKKNKGMEQEILEISFNYYVPKDEMFNFKGLKVSRNPQPIDVYKVIDIGKFINELEKRI